MALNWILKSLREGGEAFVIVPDTLLRRPSALDALREFSFVLGIASLPSKTFYSTTRRTYILALERKRRGELQTDPVFTYIVGDTGETRDTLRLEIENNDLLELVTLFRQFRAAPNSFEPASRRCKVVPAADALDREDWRVDRWRPYEERVELGLDKRRSVVGHQDFIAEIDHHATILQKIGR